MCARQGDGQYNLTGWGLFSVINALPLVSGVCLIRSSLQEAEGRLRDAFWLSLAATLFFSLGAVLVVFPLEVLPRGWMV